MVLYLAGPIESDMGAGQTWRAGFYDTLRQDHSNVESTLLVLDPYQLYRQPIGPHVIKDVAMINRLMIEASDMVLALLAGQETWREIEFAVRLGKRVCGIWPHKGNKSPVAALGVVVFDDLREFFMELESE